MTLREQVDFILTARQSPEYRAVRAIIDNEIKQAKKYKREPSVFANSLAEQIMLKGLVVMGKLGVPTEQPEPPTGAHFCKQCGKVAEGIFEDLLCAECRRDFGHALYSEL
jgi:hypothetical protein